MMITFQPMNSTYAFRISAVLGFLAVALGAIGAHELKDILKHNETLDPYRTASLYHMAHAVVMLFIASRKPFPVVPWSLFLTGTLFFSGSLYVYSITMIKVLMFFTPVGGVCFLAGWLWLAFKPLPADAA